MRNYTERGRASMEIENGQGRSFEYSISQRQCQKITIKMQLSSASFSGYFKRAATTKILNKNFFSSPIPAQMNFSN